MSGRDAILQLFEHDRGNSGHIESARLVDRQPDELDEFGVGPDQAFGAMRNCRDVGGEEAAVETQRPFRRRNGARDKMHGVEIGKDAGLGKGFPGPGRCI